MPTCTATDAIPPSDTHCILDANSFYRYFTEVCSFAHEMDGIYTRYHVNPALGDGYMEQIRFENGLEFCITSLQLKRAISLPYHLQNAPFEMHYMLEGNVYHHEKSVGNMNLSEGHLSVFFRADMEGTMTLVPGRKIVFVTIMVADSLLETVLGAYPSHAEIPWYRHSPSMCELLKPYRPTAEMKAVFGQILTCPFTKMGKSIFLQGKAMELVAHIWEQNAIGTEENAMSPLHPYEITALEQAKEHLESHMSEPIGITDLANIVGLNVQKFKSGFKQLYQTTPHQYLIRCRMMRARALMREHGYTVTEAATAVGYTNVSYFSRVFREYYGQTPKHFRFGL